MNKNEIYKRTYALLNNSTPLRTDCGKLCNHICCKNESQDFGMYLFPGEAEMFSDRPNWITIKCLKTRFIIPEIDNQIAICNGTCNRNRRPLSCRIFPLTYYLTENEVLLTRIDPRSLSICPLGKSGKLSLDYRFIRNVRLAGNILINDPDIRNFIYKLSRYFDNYAPFYPGWQKL